MNPANFSPGKCIKPCGYFVAIKAKKSLLSLIMSWLSIVLAAVTSLSAGGRLGEGWGKVLRVGSAR